MLFDDISNGVILGIVFVAIGIIFRYKPVWIFKNGYVRGLGRLVHIIIPWKRMRIILRFIGLAFLLMGIVALIISLHFLG